MPSVEDWASAFGENIRQLRMRAKWSQDRLAEEAGLHVKTVQNIERGKNALRSLTLEKLAEAFNVNQDELQPPRYNGINGGDASRNGEANGRLAPSDGAALTTIDQINHLLIPGDNEFQKWVEQTIRTALMFPNRRNVMSTMFGSILAGFGLPGSDSVAQENNALRSIQYGLDGRKVGSEIAEWARDQVVQLDRLDASIGGEQLYFIARSNLTRLQTLLQMGAASGNDERALRQALAHTAGQAGWFAEDAMLLDQAAQHYHFGVEMARSSDNKDLAVYCLARLATVELAKGNPQSCLSRLEVAESEAGKGSPWRDFILTFAVEAYTRLGDQKAAGQTLAKADALYEKGTANRLVEWSWSHKRPSLRADAIRAFLPQNPILAIKLSESALIETPKSFRQSRLHLFGGLSRAKLAVGEMDEALGFGRQVLDAVLETPTPWVEQHLMEFHAKLPDDPAARDFKERYAEYRCFRNSRA